MSDNIKIVANRQDIVAIADAVRSKTGTTSEMTLEGIASRINRMGASGGVELPELTNEGTASDMLSGKQLIDQEGNVVTGTIPTVTQATPSVSINSSGLITASATQTAGYVAAGTKSGTKQLTTQAAKTITPSTSSQTAVASGVYTTGTVTVAAIPSDYVKPSGTKSITTNGTHDVKSYASVNVNVASSGGSSSENLDTELDAQENKLNELLTILDGKAAGGGGVLSGYTLCNYIQFTGEQYIDTGIKGNQNTQICASFVWENTTQCHLYGCTSTNNTASITAYMGGAWRFGNKSSNKTLSSKNVLLPYSSLVNKTTIGMLGSATAISGVNDFETVGTLLVGGARTSDGSLPTSGFMGKVFHFRLWENDEQVLNLVPVVSDDGVYRFFDTISKTFFDSVSDTPLDGGNL